MKWTASAFTCSALLALAATALLGRSLQQQGAGAVAAPTASRVGLASPSSPAAAQLQAPNQAATAAARSAATPAAAPVSTSSPPAPTLHFSYIGHWTARGRTQVVLQREGLHFTVQGPGRLDDAYDVLAISAQQLTLLHRASGTRHTLVFDAPGSAWSTVGTLAGLGGVSGGAGKGSLQAAPVGVVPPAHAPINRPGDTEDQQESN